MRRVRAETLLQINLTRRGHQQILSAHDMRDSLFGIVRDYGKLIRPKTVRTQQDEIADIVCQILGVIADNPILKTDYPVGNGNPPSRRFPIRFRPCAGTRQRPLYTNPSAPAVAAACQSLRLQ